MSDLELIFTMLGEINKWHSVAETLLGWLVSKTEKSWVVVIVSPENFLSDSDKQDDTLELPFFENNE